MFYVENSGSRKRDVLLLHILPTAIIFLAFLAATFLSWSAAIQNVQDDQLKVLQQNNASIQNFLGQRIDDYEDILRGARGLFDSSQSVTRQEWGQYVESYSVARRFPAVQAAGYIEVMNGSNQVTYIEPASPINSALIGQNLQTNQSLTDVLNQTRDGGEPVTSPAMTINQSKDSSTDQKLGFMMFMPVYTTGSRPADPVSRRASIKGYLFVTFKAQPLIDQVLPRLTKGFGFQAYDVENQDKKLVYESHDYQVIRANPAAISSSQVIKIPGTSWQIDGVATQEVVSQAILARTSSTIWAGLIFSLAVAGFIYMLLGNRARALAEKEEISIQEAKDELLALASHQLRTPATGVKQYVGMLLEGYAGRITSQQRELLTKAYQSNDRQLGTINEMLVVARADAGHLNITFDDVNLNQLVESVVDEQRGVIAARQQSVKVVIPKTKIVVSGDNNYIRMAIENIVSNATKYTHTRGKLSVRLRRNRGSACIIVTDNGVGVAPEDFDRLFGKFSRIHNELTEQVIGSGIGLYLAKQIAESHGGEINFESAAGKGSTVIITLPLKPKVNKPKLFSNPISKVS